MKCRKLYITDDVLIELALRMHIDALIPFICINDRLYKLLHNELFYKLYYTRHVQECKYLQDKTWLDNVLYESGLKKLDDYTCSVLSSNEEIPKIATNVQLISLGIYKEMLMPRFLYRLYIDSVWHVDNIIMYDTLKELEINNVNISVINELPIELEVLKLTDCNVCRIQFLPKRLKTLTCRNGLLTDLPKLPNTLTFIDVSNNLLTSIDVPPYINVLIVTSNRLSNLVLNDGIEKLYCDSNRITSFEMLPESLRYINCSNNFLTKLPRLPSKLRSLLCSNNMIKHMPILPSTIDFFIGTNNDY